jgi:hypothetical protein
LVFFAKAKKYLGDYDGYWLEIIGDEIITKKKKGITGDDSMAVWLLDVGYRKLI